MEFGVKSGTSEKQRSGCVIVGIHESGKLTESAQLLDELSEGFLSNILTKGDIKGKVGQSLLLHAVPNLLAERILLVGCGKEKELNDSEFKKILTKAISTLKNTGTQEATSHLTELSIKDRDEHWKIRQTIVSVRESYYRFEALQTKKENKKQLLKKFFCAISPRKNQAAAEIAVHEGNAIANGIALAKELGNLPGNICTPSYLADQANSLANHFKSIKTRILEEEDMNELGMGALLSVSKGSRQPAKLIVMEYNGGKKEAKPVVLVGKGLTFDAGGISLKPGASMDEMKFDMCGSASVFGTIKALAEMDSPINVTGIVPSSENLPDGNANKPGDVVTSMAGTTIEILNTDAEGRLLLCDALTYAEQFNPDVVIDIATLTGACVIALGKHASGLFSNYTPLTKAIQQAAEQSGDKVWELPLWDDYQEQLKTNFADVANIGGRDAGSITAACFLSRFTKKYHWAHLDIAGTAWLTGTDKGATGRPVPLLIQFLMNRCHE